MTPHPIIGILIIVTVVVLGVWAVFGLARTSAEVYKKLDEFKAEAEATDEYLSLCDINTRLIEYANKYCVIRQYGAAAKEVNIFITTKANVIRKLSHKHKK